MIDYDSIVEGASRRLAKTVSRRSVLRTLGTLLVGASSLPLLPVARGQSGVKEKGDQAACDYWRYCAIDGFLCTCCGGGVHTCPPGSQAAPTSWIGTCLNPEDSRTYLISYRDCCGVGGCGQCFCRSTERETPVYRPQGNNDIIWCFGTSSMEYHCSTAALVGLAE